MDFGQDTHSIWLQHQDRTLLIGIPNCILRIFHIRWRQHSTKYCTHICIWGLALFVIVVNLHLMNTVIEDRKGSDAYTPSQLWFEDAGNFIILRRDNQCLKNIYSNIWWIAGINKI